MICIYCLHNKTKVCNSRTQKNNPQVWRRRSCIQCGKTFTSYERAASADILVDNGNSTMPFNIGTLTISIANSSGHNKSQQRYDSYYLAQTIELTIIKLLAQTDSRVISTKDIIKIAYNTLKKFDEITALQYAMQHGHITSLRRRGRPSVREE